MQAIRRAERQQHSAPTAQSVLRRVLWVVVWALLLGVSGCGGTPVITPFAPGLTPRPLVVLAAWPEVAGTLLASRGEHPEGGVWVEGRALIDKPLDEVVTAFLDPALMVDPEGIESFEATWGVEPDYAQSVCISQKTAGIISVSFDVTWRMAPQLDAQGKTQSWAAVYQKTAGTSLVDRLEGSIFATAKDADTTAIEFYALVDAPRVDEEVLEDSVRRMYDGLVTRVGELP